jgi:hypothetical protein
MSLFFLRQSNTKLKCISTFSKYKELLMYELLTLKCISTFSIYKELLTYESVTYGMILRHIVLY